MSLAEKLIEIDYGSIWINSSEALIGKETKMEK